MLRPLLLCALMMAAMAVKASPISATLPWAALRGEATFKMLGVAIYDARLFTKSGAALDWSEDFAIELTYRRDLTQYDLVEGTLREFKRAGTPLPLGTELRRCYFDVAKGDRYTAITSGPNLIGFWRNDTKTCDLSYPGISKRFMGIFVGDNTRSRRFTQQLRGGE